VLNAEPWHVIDKSLYGLPGVAFGGYVGGLLGAELDCDTKVDFRAPTPRETQLEIRRGRGRHPDCFGCGPDRRSDSGLRIFPGLTEPGDLVAACGSRRQTSAVGAANTFRSSSFGLPWTARVPGARRRIVQSDRRALTAYLAAAITRPVRVGEPTS
jgi:hypothetical protein